MIHGVYLLSSNSAHEYALGEQNTKPKSLKGKGGLSLTAPVEEAGQWTGRPSSSGAEPTGRPGPYLRLPAAAADTPPPDVSLSATAAGESARGMNDSPTTVRHILSGLRLRSASRADMDPGPDRMTRPSRRSKPGQGTD